MSLFKKPNKNIRRREVEVNDDDTDVKESEISVVKTKPRNGSPVTTTMKQTLLSFGEEWNECDDGEVFKVKKSIHSRKIRRQADKEREEKRKKNLKQEQITQSQEKQLETIVTTDDMVTIKIKNPIAGPAVTGNTILTGLSAEMADYKSESDDEEDTSHHKFTQPDHVRMLLKSGQIPDAALIHAARKRRQQAREMGVTSADYININNSENSNTAPRVNENLSRLIREDDNELSDDEEERISMAGIVSFSADREKNKEGLDTFILSEDDEKGDDEWETQQIRKAVTGAQLAAAQAQQESYYNMQYMSNAVSTASLQQLPPNINSSAVPAIPIIPSVTHPIFETASIIPINSVYSSLDENIPLNSDDISKNLKNRLTKLTEAFNKSLSEQKSINEQLVELKSDEEKRKSAVSGLAERFQFYQDLRGYVTDLVECLDEKIPLINSLEQRLINLYQKQASDLINRRRQDIKDQVEEITSSSKALIIKKDNERIRRAAEREGRRIRRAKTRDILEAHIEGMSSDDEITEMTAVAYRNQKDVIESDAQHVFEDVVDEFTNINSILKQFSEWKKLDKTAYTEAYANICLPKAVGPIVRKYMLMWNPLNKEDTTNFENLKWVQSVIMYCADKNETMDSLQSDPDTQLLPKIVDKVIIPKLEQIIKVQWDPLSSTETKHLVLFIRLILEYPSITPKSKQLVQLMNTIVDKMKECVENDVFIPLFPKQAGDNSRLNSFFQRQFAMTVKLFGNVLSWHNIIKESILIEIALSSLLNRYLLMSIRTLQPIEAASKCLLVSQYLPCVWLQNKFNCPPQLSPFLEYVKLITSKLDSSQPFVDRLILLIKNL